ncbi:MAG TPA: hypothetical protein VGQ83_09975 [Polyangia bacterium]|jgi:hypothetical protein
MSAPDLATLDERGRYELAAWLWALKDHWPRRFARELGADGEQALEALAPATRDRDRVLKLRRLAIGAITNGDLGPLRAAPSR